MAAAAIPIIASAVGGVASSRGAKKAAKANQGPQIPAAFRPLVGQATSLLGQRLGQGAAGLMPGSSQLLDLAGQGGGFQGALAALTQTAQSGLNPATIEAFRKQFAPLFEQQKAEYTAGSRQSQAARGIFFGSGGVQQENLGLSNLINQQGASLIPLALQSQGLQMQAAQGLPSLLHGALQSLDYPTMSTLQALSALMGSGGAPFYNPPVAPNSLMTGGALLSNTAASPGFQAWIESLTKKPVDYSQYPAPKGTSYGS